MPNLYDRIKETTTTTGTGNITLGGAVTNYRSFSSVVSSGATCNYVIENTTAAEWECGIGTMSGTSTLVRTTVTASSNNNSAVNFSSGTKNIWIDATANYLNSLSASVGGYNLVVDPGSGTITFDVTTGKIQELTLTRAGTQLALSNDQIGQTYEIILKQDATGGRTVSWFAGILWPGGVTPTLTTNSGKRDVFSFQKIASGVYLGFVIGQNL